MSASTVFMMKPQPASKTADGFGHLDPRALRTGLPVPTVLAVMVGQEDRSQSQAAGQDQETGVVRAPVLEAEHQTGDQQAQGGDDQPAKPDVHVHCLVHTPTTSASSRIATSSNQGPSILRRVIRAQ